MTREQMTAFYARRLEALNRHDSEALTLHHAEEGVVDSPFSGGVFRGRDEIEKTYTSFFRAFPDVKMSQDALVIDGNHAASLLIMSGTGHSGIMGLPPASRAFSMPIVALDEFEDGLIIRQRRIYDFTGLLIQIGVIKAKPV